MTGFYCPVCNGDMHEELYEPVAWCDTCGLIIRADGSWNLSEMDVESLDPDETMLKILYEHGEKINK